MPNLTPSLLSESYTIRRNPKQEVGRVAKAYEIAKFCGDKEPIEVGEVHEYKNGNCWSDDPGFRKRPIEATNKRIQMVKKFQELNEPHLASFWISQEGDVAYNVVELLV